MLLDYPKYCFWRPLNDKNKIRGGSFRLGHVKFMLETPCKGSKKTMIGPCRVKAPVGVRNKTS